MPDSFELETIVAAEPPRVFSAWMDGREHAAFTGGGEAVVEPWTGGRFIAWDGYIHGILIGVEDNRRIVQTWRTSEFPPESRDSRVVVEFEAARGGTRVTVRHSDLPPSQLKRYERGWLEHYLKPLVRYFAKGKKTPAPPAAETSWGRKSERVVRAAQKSAARKATQKPAARKRSARKPSRKPPAKRKSGARARRR